MPAINLHASHATKATTRAFLLGKTAVVALLLCTLIYSLLQQPVQMNTLVQKPLHKTCATASSFQPSLDCACYGSVLGYNSHAMLTANYEGAIMALSQVSDIKHGERLRESSGEAEVGEEGEWRGE